MLLLLLLLLLFDSSYLYASNSWRAAAPRWRIPGLILQWSAAQSAALLLGQQKRYAVQHQRHTVLFLSESKRFLKLCLHQTRVFMSFQDKCCVLSAGTFPDQVFRFSLTKECSQGPVLEVWSFEAASIANAGAARQRHSLSALRSVEPRSSDVEHDQVFQRKQAIDWKQSCFKFVLFVFIFTFF